MTATFGDAAAPKTETVTFRVIPAKDKTGTPSVQAIRKGDRVRFLPYAELYG